MLCAVAADVDGTRRSHILSREAAVANAKRALAQSHVAKRTFGGLLRCIGAERQHAVANDRQIAVNQFNIAGR